MHVYIVRAGRHGPYKIGVARDVNRRVAELQIGNHQELFIVAKFDFQSDKKAFAIEKKMHRMFRKQRIRGEWFSKNIRLSRVDGLLHTDFEDQSTRSMEKINEKHNEEVLDIQALSSIPERF